MKGIAEGEIQAVATDHCPFNYGKEKQLGKDDFTNAPMERREWKNA